MKYIIAFLISLAFFSCKKEKSTSIQRDDKATYLSIPLSGSLQNPAFSPDGNSLVFTRFINGYNKEPAEIYKYELNTKELSLLVSNGSGNINLPGAIWNNGKIVFASTREPHDEIFVIAENGHSGEEIKITNRLNKVAYEPSLSPDGEWVVFESHILDVEDNGIITKYKINGSSSYLELTDTEDDCRQPNWSPEGNKILYQKKANGQWNIWIMNTDGTNKTKITNNIGNCTDASFASDGQSIVFSSDYQVKIANIYSLSIDGSNLTKLTTFEGYDGATSISTNGKVLTFESSNEDPDDSSGTRIAILELN